MKCHCKQEAQPLLMVHSLQSRISLTQGTLWELHCQLHQPLLHQPQVMGKAEPNLEAPQCLLPCITTLYHKLGGIEVGVMTLGDLIHHLLIMRGVMLGTIPVRLGNVDQQLRNHFRLSRLLFKLPFRRQHHHQLLQQALLQCRRFNKALVLSLISKF